MAAGSVTRCCVSARAGNRIPEYPAARSGRAGACAERCNFGPRIGARVRSFVRAMPSTEVSIELKTAWHRNGDKVWTANDIYDIDAMSLTVPYCDVVVPDKAFYHVLNSAGLGERMHTALLRNLVDLPSTLDRWKPKRGLRKLMSPGSL